MAIPTPEQARELVDHFGSQRAAAEAVGAGSASVQRWIHPDVARRYRSKHKAEAAEYQRAWKAANPEKNREYWRRSHAKHREKRTAASRERYHNSSWLERNERQLKRRRNAALQRIANRNQRRQDSGAL